MTKTKSLKKIRKICVRLAQPDIMFFTLPWLIFLLIIGTIAQKDLGLYQSEQLFFSSWILWLGIIPLPGGLTTLSIILVNLFAKFIFKSKWSWRGGGTVLTHFGILLLFIGALFSNLTTKEGFMLIPEGQSSNRILDYYEKNFYIFADDNQIAAFSFQDLEKQNVLTIPETSLTLKILDTCENCQFLEARQSSTDRIGLAEKIELKNESLNKEQEANLSGVTFRLNGSETQDGIYVSTEAAPHSILILDRNKIYRLQFQKEETKLPFTFTLHNFEQILHPGTETPSHFHSDLEISDGANTWNARISMNEPLRYKGYTFFQSSYADTPAGQATILAVVQNDGWLFPYVSSVIIAIGLLLHLIIRLRGSYE